MMAIILSRLLPVQSGSILKVTGGDVGITILTNTDMFTLSRGAPQLGQSSKVDFDCAPTERMNVQYSEKDRSDDLEPEPPYPCPFRSNQALKPQSDRNGFKPRIRHNLGKLNALDTNVGFCSTIDHLDTV